jgi:hypothetical protein
MSQPVLKFRFLKNVMLELHPDYQFSIPMRLVPKEDQGYQIMVPEFDLSKVHELPLLDEIPDLPSQELGEDASDATHLEYLNREAYDLARENRKENEKVRKAVYHHVGNGNIEIVDDPFARRKVKVNTRNAKPSELAAQADAEAAVVKNKGGRPRKNP